MKFCTKVECVTHGRTAEPFCAVAYVQSGKRLASEYWMRNSWTSRHFCHAPSRANWNRWRREQSVARCHCSGRTCLLCEEGIWISLRVCSSVYTVYRSAMWWHCMAIVHFTIMCNIRHRGRQGARTQPQVAVRAWVICAYECEYRSLSVCVCALN